MCVPFFSASHLFVQEYIFLFYNFVVTLPVPLTIEPGEGKFFFPITTFQRHAKNEGTATHRPNQNTTP
tara:strand:- start:662 stop:865 length:204 start_codon:yes stop_codon:yes gene_type:complete